MLVHNVILKKCDGDGRLCSSSVLAAAVSTGPVKKFKLEL